MAGVEHLRVMTKVARLYHLRGFRQTEIASRLGISQARVSRLLRAAEAAQIVRTVVAVPPGLHADLEESLEARYGLQQAHVVDPLDDRDEAGLTADLGAAAAQLLASLPLVGRTVGYTPWSRSLRVLATAGVGYHGGRGTQVVEMIGDVGAPALQHEATRATQLLADRLGAVPLFLRVPGVVASRAVRDAVTEHDAHTRGAMARLDHLDIALTGIGQCGLEPPLTAGDNFFDEEQLARARALGAVAQMNLRFLDALGRPVDAGLDDLVIGVSLPQLRAAGRRIGVAGGARKYEAVRAVIRGGWIDTLVTDADTAERLLAEPV